MKRWHHSEGSGAGPGSHLLRREREREKQQKKPAISEAVSQLMTAFTGGSQQPMPPPQQLLPLFSQQLLAVLPLQPTAKWPK